MRSKGVQCRAIRRCFLVFTAIALLPLALVYLVTNEQAYKLKGYEMDVSEAVQPGCSGEAMEQVEMVTFDPSPGPSGTKFCKDSSTESQIIMSEDEPFETLPKIPRIMPLPNSSPPSSESVIIPYQTAAVTHYRQADADQNYEIKPHFLHISNATEKEKQTLATTPANVSLLPAGKELFAIPEALQKLISKSEKAYSKRTLVERSFRYPLMILGPLKALAKRAVGKSGRSSPYRHSKRHKYFDNDTTLQTLPDDIVRTMPPNKLEVVEQRMKARQKHLAQKCSELGLDIPGNDSIHKPNSWEFLVNHKYHLIWCNVFKSASSSWMYNFNVLAGYSPAFLKKTTDIPLVLARKKYPRVSLDELQEAQNDSITFIIARHPFERLLSAYRDKFIFALPHSYHDKLGNKIIRTYRKNKGDRHLPKYPTFGEFVSWLLDEVRKNNYIDMHLVPATKFCTPCLIKFDIIVKFETLEEDQMYLIEKAGLSNVIMPEWRNTGKGKKTLELLQTFYSQLTRKQLDGLYNYFRYDFEVFGYSATPYFNIVRTEENADTNNL